MCWAGYYILPHRCNVQRVVPMSLIVPLIPRDFESCIELIQSINENTVLPTEMIIGLSGGSLYKAKRFERNVRKTLDNRISFNLSFDPKTCNAAKNRNRASRLSSQPILTYFDGDDLMHKRRLEIVWDVFSNYNIDVFYHGFCEKKMENLYSNPFTMTNQNLIKHQNKSGWPHVKKYKDTEGICAGHVSMKREVFDLYPFDESPEVSRSEDAAWADKALHSNLRVFYIHLPLTFYRRSNS